MKKTTVEDCLTLSMGVLADRRGFREQVPWRGTLRWTKVRTGEEVATIGYTFWPLGEGQKWDGRVRLKYTITRSSESGRNEEKTEVESGVNLETTPCNFGGERWWFRCPIIYKGSPCERRCFKLYCPPGADYYGCRECYNLTYESAQTAHEFDTLCGHIAGDMGIPMERVKELLGRGTPGP